MSLLITAVVVGSGLLAASTVTFLASRRRKHERAAEKEESEPSQLSHAGFDIELGDVIGIGGRELWLERGWLLSEGTEAVAAVLFSDPDVLVALPPPTARLCLLQAVDVELPAELPATLEVHGQRFERTRRLPVTVVALAGAQPPPWDSALFSEYRGLSDQSLWIVGNGQFAHVYVGRAVADAEIERWGGGSSTLTGRGDE